MYRFIQKEIQIVAAEQMQHESGNFEDKIDHNVACDERARLFKKCYNCNFQNVPKARHTCPECKVNLTKSMMRSLGLDETGNEITSGSSSSNKRPKEFKVTVNVSESSNVRQKQSIHYEEQSPEGGPFNEFSGICQIE